MAIWSGQSDGNFDLFAADHLQRREIVASRSGSPPRRFSDFNARAVADAAGQCDPGLAILPRRQRRYLCPPLHRHRGDRKPVSPHSGSDDWDPAVALDRNGTAWISWDGYDTGNYDVFLRSFDGRKLGDVIAITTEPAAQFHSSVAVDGAGRVWVAWDEADLNWGKDFSEVSTRPAARACTIRASWVARLRQRPRAGALGGFRTHSSPAA